MVKIINDYVGHVTCSICDWHGDAGKMHLTTRNGNMIYVCPKCLSDKILNF